MNGWKIVTDDPFDLNNVKLWFDYFLFVPVALHIGIDIATCPVAYTGSSLEECWQSKTFVANNDYTTIIHIGMVKIDIPLTRDHFRIWDIGSHVMGSGTYDNGLWGETITALLEIFNDPIVYAAIFLLSIINPLATAAALITILVAAGFFDVLLGTFNAGHLIDQNNPWKTADTAKETWLIGQSEGEVTTLDRLSSPSDYTWTLTGRTLTWYGTAYDQYTSGGGGGGCVAKNTEILLADGMHTKKVQNIKVGDWILGYNISSGNTMPVQVTKITKSFVPAILSINEGLLNTTVVDQPIYMRNETYTGWLRDPQNLQVGEKIFHVPTQQWIIVWRLDTVTGKKFKVYDVNTNPLNVFVGNGILLDPSYLK